MTPQRVGCREADCADPLVPVLLGDGIRFFSSPGIEPINLEKMSVAESGPLTDLRFRVVK